MAKAEGKPKAKAEGEAKVEAKVEAGSKAEAKVDTPPKPQATAAPPLKTEAKVVDPVARAYAPSHRVGMEVSIAVSDAVQLCRAEAIAAYPITPQTHIVEHLSSVVANGDLDAEFVNVESEHSAMSTCIGMSATGARTYTATSSQGLALMNEILFIASAMRFPIVMTVANRALSGPLVHLERPQRHHGGPGHRLDPDLRGKRPGGLRPLRHGLQDRRKPQGPAAHHHQPGRLHPLPRGGGPGDGGPEDRGRFPAALHPPASARHQAARSPWGPSPCRKSTPK